MGRRTDGGGRGGAGAPFSVHPEPVGTSGIRPRRGHWKEAAWWTYVALLLAATIVLIWTDPAHAQDTDINTCQVGGGVGGEGGAQIIDGIRNLALLAAAIVGGLTVLGIVGSGALMAVGAMNRDLLRKGGRGVTFGVAGGGTALLAASIWGAMTWAFCQGA